MEPVKQDKEKKQGNKIRIARNQGPALVQFQQGVAEIIRKLILKTNKIYYWHLYTLLRSEDKFYSRGT